MNALLELDSMTTTIDVTRSTEPRTKSDEANLGFGRVFTDHMYLQEWSDGEWGRARIVPFGPLTLDPAAAVFHYGQAMFEGQKAFRGRDGKVRLFRAREHCNRLANGAPRLCMPSPDPAALHEGIRALIALDSHWAPSREGTALYVRPTLIATEPMLGVRAAKEYLLFVIVSAVGPYYSGGMRPLRLWVEDRYVRAAAGGLGAVKASANYAASLLAAKAAQEQGYDQVIWQDAQRKGLLEEMGVMNLFVRIGDRIVTPPLEGTILGGVTRDSALALMRRWGLDVAEAPITFAEVERAHARGELAEVFGTGTAAVVASVGELGSSRGTITVGSGGIGDLARRLHAAITAIQYGEGEDPFGWTEVVA